jgi:hypothetical protein
MTSYEVNQHTGRHTGQQQKNHETDCCPVIAVLFPVACFVPEFPLQTKQINGYIFNGITH